MTGRPQPLLPCLVLALLVEAIVFATAAQVGLFGAGEVGDHRCWITAGTLVREGRGADLSSLEAQREVQRRLFPGMPDDALLPWVNPPFVALVFAPLSLLPPRAFALVWSTVVALATGALLKVVLDEVRPGRPRSVAIVLFLTFLPVAAAIVNGQVSPFLAFAPVGARRELGRGRDGRAGLWLALLALKPQLVALPALLLALHRRGRALAGLALGLAVAATVSLAVSGPAGLVAYQRLLGEAMTWDGANTFRPERMHTVRGVLAGLVGLRAGAFVPLYVAGEALVVALLVVASRGSPRPATARFDRVWAALGLASVLASPHLYLHDLSLLLLPAALLSEGARAPGARALDRGLGLFPFALAVAVPAWGATHGRAGMPVPFVVALCLVALGALAARSEPVEPMAVPPEPEAA